MISSEVAGTLLRRARKRRGLSLDQLARRSGVAKSTLSLYENGRQQPSVATLDHILGTLGVELTVNDSVPRASDKAIALARVCALGMSLPRKDRGPLTYPPFKSLVAK
jgi:transcriptional regulator with XRE-family HTH domain